MLLTVLTTTIKYNEYTTDKGKNISIPCGEDKGTTMWIKQNGNSTDVIQTGHSLSLRNVSETDAGIYICLKLHKIFNASNPNETIISSTTEEAESEYYKSRKVLLIVRTPPGPVNLLWFKASTILGYLIWRFNATTNSGGYPVRSFTAEYRNVSPIENQTYPWSRLDPINISPNIRQMEVYKLEPNTTYEFRIWANNALGPGEIVTTVVTTLPETKEEDLIRLISADLVAFDPRVWIAAVSVVLGTLVILAIGLCVVLAKECYNAPVLVDEDEDGWDSIELVPNIILNPGFCESDDHDTPYTRTIIFGEDDESDGYDDEEEEKISFKRKVSIFFTGDTIRRI
ncbi:uncharacterized protein LOC119657813 isoform X2 [Hermetia illucens]|uniref:uncharacterized protein LOC119657813 isoform X2 n=1 Tax=Hermetia illucens TaxID=343691 RepID=UPI0018CC2ADC|nr:uncharacterized protein LOC119657813 isoform X2 [Hermetia illucens]